jgi:hypothetical protein
MRLGVCLELSFKERKAMPAPKFTPETIAKMGDLRTEGLSYAEIEAHTGMSKGSIYWHCLKEGIDTPEPRRRPLATNKTMVVRRGNHTVRRFTPEEDAKITAMRVAGDSIADICRATGRRHNSIIGRLMTLARAEERECNT